MGGMASMIKETKSFELWLYVNLSNETPRYQFRLRNKADENDEHEIFIPSSMIGIMDWERPEVEMLRAFWKEL